MVGDCDVGKTALCQRWNNNKFTADYTATIGIDFNVAHVIIRGGDKIKCQLWDTAGQESFREDPIVQAGGLSALLGSFLKHNKDVYKKFKRHVEKSDTPNSDKPAKEKKEKTKSKKLGKRSRKDSVTS